MFFKCNKTAGYTLMEVILAIGIVAALAAIALPTYLMYSDRSRFSEVVMAAERYKNSVAVCINSNQGTSGCNAHSNGILGNMTTPTGIVNSVTVTDGQITAVPTNSGNFTSADTYILTPTYTPQSITWTASGGACAKGYAHCE